MKNFVYILLCEDESLYTGWTNNLKKRMKSHFSGRGAKYTKVHKPKELVFVKSFDKKEDAMSFEYLTKKKKDRVGKLELILSSDNEKKLDHGTRKLLKEDLDRRYEKKSRNEDEK